MNHSEQEQKALKLYAAGKYDEALVISLELSRHLNNVGLFLCGLVLELGISSKGKDLPGAYKYFDLLRKNNDDEGYIGCARIMLEDNSIGPAEMAAEFCLQALAIRNNQFAHLLLGKIYEFMYGESHYEQATKSYAKAALGGATLGWRRIALLEKKKGNHIYSILMHIFATIISPFYLIFGGLRTSRDG